MRVFSIINARHESARCSKGRCIGIRGPRRPVEVVWPKALTLAGPDRPAAGDPRLGRGGRDTLPKAIWDAR